MCAASTGMPSTTPETGEDNDWMLSAAGGALAMQDVSNRFS
jgi:hypothetical protein